MSDKDHFIIVAAFCVLGLLAGAAADHAIMADAHRQDRAEAFSAGFLTGRDIGVSESLELNVGLIKDGSEWKVPGGVTLHDRFTISGAHDSSFTNLSVQADYHGACFNFNGPGNIGCSGVNVDASK